MKSFTHKLFAIVFSIALFTGCASVTDPGLDQTQPDIEQPAQVDNPDFGTEAGMDPIYDRPE
jgi:PBP1b-binding outer membrane lipoprotein LpoB